MAYFKKTNTSVGGSGQIRSSDTAGTDNIGLVYDVYVASLEKAQDRKAADMLRAQGAEKALLQNEIDELTRRLSNLPADHTERMAELADLKDRLAPYGTQIGKDKLLAACAALHRGDTSLAEALFTDLALKARERQNDTESEEAKLLFELGKLAEAKVEWAEAAKLYGEAARLDPGFHHLNKAREFSCCIEAYDDALLWGEALLVMARKDCDQTRIGSALKAQATVLKATGRYAEAEPLYSEAQAITRQTLGPEHLDYAADLNNLAGLLRATGRSAEAEPLYREAMAITRKTLGPEHPDYAVALNNLALLLMATRRYGEAEPLFRDAQAITRKTVGSEHPDYASDLNNLAALLEVTSRLAEAEQLYREAMAITRNTLGLSHPDYARDLHNLAGLLQAIGRDGEAVPLYREAVEILQINLGADHPNTQAVKQILQNLLEARRETDAD